METALATFNIHGLFLRISAESKPLMQRAEAILGAFRQLSISPSFYGLDIRYGPVEDSSAPLEPMRLYWSGFLADGLPMSYYTAPGARRIVIDQRARLELDLKGRAARLFVKQGQEWCIGHACLVPMLCEITAQEGMHTVHAACLAADCGEQYRAVLVSGVSGRGKTTASLALANAGLDLLGDDTCFVCRPADGASENAELKVWGLRLPCKVHDRTLELLPWLAPLPRRPASTPNEHIIDTAQLWPVRTVLAAPRLVLFLDERNDQSHRLREIDKVQALSRLANENVRAIDPSGTGPGGRAFQTLARLVSQCRTYTLSAGPDFPSLPEQVIGLLRGDSIAPM